MPDTFDKVLFEGEFDPNEIIKGVDGMIDAYKRAKASGDVTNETLAKMEGAIDSVTDAATSLQKVTGKGIVPSLGDNKIVQQLTDIGTKVKETSGSIQKAAADSSSVINKLKAANIQLTEGIKAQTAEYNKNAKQIAALQAQQKAAFNTTSDYYKNLTARINGLQQANVNLSAALAQEKQTLKDSEAAIKSHSSTVSFAEKEHSKLRLAVEKLTSVDDIAAKGITKFERTLDGLLEGGVVGIAIAVAGPVIDAFKGWYEELIKVSDKVKLLQANQQNLNEVVADANKHAGEQITDLKILYQEATNANAPLNERLAAVKALQIEFPDYFKNIKTETILNGGAKESYDALTASIIATSRAKAVKDKLDDLESKRLDVEFNKQKIRNATDKESAAAKQTSAEISTGGGIAGTGGGEVESATVAQQREVIKRRRDAALAQQDENDKFLKDQEDFLTKFVGLGNLAKVVEGQNQGKKERQRKEIVNIYEEELQKLRADLAKLDEKGFTDEATITKAIEEDFKKRDLGFQKAFKNKQLTAGQLVSLQDNLKNLQQLTLDKALKDFNAQKAEYLQKINDAIETLQNEESLKRISLIQDNFERERQTIVAEANKTISSLAIARDKQIADISKNAAKNGITAAQLKPEIDKIKETYARLIDDLGLIRDQKLQKLAFDTFEKLSEDAKRILDSGNLGVSTGSLINIQQQTQLFLAGKISYQQYQKQLTQISRAEATERFNIEKNFLQSEIKIRQDKLLTDKSLTDDQIKKLQDEIRRLQQQLVDAEKGNAITGASNTKADKDQRLNDLLKYAQAIESVAQSVIGFWQQANEAEQKALERSIAIQDRRVAAAQLVAEKGNAEYLRLEEERQQALIIKQEDAARRTLAINAALQASQLLVALISGIAQGAKVGGALGAVIEVGSLVAAIAGAFAIAQSLKPPTPSFFVGTEDTGPGGSADKRGGFHSILHPHERVIPAHDNKHLKGISNKQLIETVNRHKIMVENYASPKLPQLNLAAMDMATEVSATQNIRLAGIMEDNNRELKENNMLQKQTHRLLKGMGVSVNFDANGVAVMVREVSDRIEKSKKS